MVSLATGTPNVSWVSALLWTLATVSASALTATKENIAISAHPPTDSKEPVSILRVRASTVVHACTKKMKNLAKPSQSVVIAVSPHATVQLDLMELCARKHEVMHQHQHAHMQRAIMYIPGANIYFYLAELNYISVYCTIYL